MAGFSELIAECGLFFVKALILVYDIVTLPIYWLLQQPWKAKRASEVVQAKREVSGDRSSPLVDATRQLNPESMAHQSQSVNDIFKKASIKFKDVRCVGIREVMMEEQEEQDDGSIVTKKILATDFKWMSFAQTDKRIDDIMKGLLLNGIKGPDKKVLLYMENRLEWMLSAHAVFRTGATLVIARDNIASKVLASIFCEITPEVVISSSRLLQKVLKANPKESPLKIIIFAEDKVTQNFVNNKAFEDDDENDVRRKIKEEKENQSSSPVTQQTLREVELRGSQASPDLKGPLVSTRDTAIIVYTEDMRKDGPSLKGVVISHKNLVSSIHSLESACSDIVRKSCNSVYPAFISSVNISEFVTQQVMLINGIPIAFSASDTLTGKSSSVKAGEKGDVSLVTPTLIHATPTHVDSFRRFMSQEVDSRSCFSKRFFDFALSYKNYWINQGYNTTIMNSLVFSDTAKNMGGKTNLLMVSCSTDVLSPTTQDFMRSVLDANVITGFGCTESTGLATLKLINDTIDLNSCGAVLPGVRIKLKDWARGSFFTYDHPNPRGEILIGGDTVSSGYFNNQTLTDEHFEIDSDSVSWFKTGMIGEFHSSGKVEVIDSMENLIKLSFGSSLISLGRSEAELRSCSFIENICLYADSSNNFIIAFVCCSKAKLQSLCKNLDIEEGSLSYKEMCSDPEVQAEVTKAIVEHGLKAGLPKKLLPSKVKLCTEIWTPESGLVSSDMSPVRHEIARFYSKDLNRMFGNIDHNSNNPRSAQNHNNNNNSTSRPTKQEVTVQMETREGIEMTYAVKKDDETNTSPEGQ